MTIVATGLDMTDRRNLEHAMLDITTREQRRIGQDLHDDLGQRLTGIAFLSRVLQDSLEKASRAEASGAGTIATLVNEAIERTRELSRGLAPVITEQHGLMTALRRRAEEISGMLRIPCAFECPAPVAIANPEVAHHLYYIAQEAVSNAIKHGKPNRVTIGLTVESGAGRLLISDDGIGCEPSEAECTGLGRFTMEHRARIIHGSLQVESSPNAGTTVTCVFPVA